MWTIPSEPERATSSYKVRAGSVPTPHAIRFRATATSPLGLEAAARFIAEHAFQTKAVVVMQLDPAAPESETTTPSDPRRIVTSWSAPFLAYLKEGSQ